MRLFINYTYLLLSIVFLLTSCTKFLNKLPEDSVPTTSILGTEAPNIDNTYGVVSGVYASVATDPSLGHWMLQGLLNVRTLDINKGENPNNAPDLFAYQKFNYSTASNYWALQGVWGGFYSTIAVANSAIKALDEFAVQAPTLTTTLNQYKAEVRVLRSLIWFYAVRLYGVAILATDNATMGTTSPTKPADAYLFMLNELNQSIPYLPRIRPNQQTHKGAVTAFTAAHLKAKIFSDLAGNAGNTSADGQRYWDSILTITNDIITNGGFSLYSDIYHVFTKTGQLSDESLYEMQYSDFGTTGTTFVASSTWSPVIFFFNGPKQLIAQANYTEPSTGATKANPNADRIYGGWSFMKPNQVFVDFLNNRGDIIRAKAYVYTVGTATPFGDMVADDYDKYTNGKFCPPTYLQTVGRAEFGMGNNVRVLRYADVLLLNAEALVRKGQNGAIPLNLVRDRAKLGTIATPTLQDVLDERRAEFIGEWGEAFFDFVRTGALSGPLASTQNSTYKASSQYYPVPQNQLDINPVLRAYLVANPYTY